MKNTNEQKHTPTPWYQVGMYFETEKNRLLGKALALKGKSVNEDAENEEQAKANAAFIVRAANSYDRHIELLRKVFNSGLIPSKCPGVQCNGDSAYCFSCEILREINQAEGE